MFCAMLRKLAKYTTLLNLHNAKICCAGFPETKRKEITKRFFTSHTTFLKSSQQF